MATMGGVGHLFHGLRLMLHPSIRPFVIIPLTFNMVLFGIGIYTVHAQIDELLVWVTSRIPSWLMWIEYLLGPILVTFFMVVYGLLFSTLTNILAAPFNGLLAERVEQLLTQRAMPDVTALALLQDVPRIMGREFTKLGYYVPRALGCLVLFFVPLVGQTLAPVLWFLFSAWMMAVQYSDYAFDNHKIAFASMRGQLAKRRGQSLSFGALVALGNTIPVLNLMVMPVAVCGATSMWVDYHRVANLTPTEA